MVFLDKDHNKKLKSSNNKKVMNVALQLLQEEETKIINQIGNEIIQKQVDQERQKVIKESFVYLQDMKNLFHQQLDG